MKIEKTINLRRSQKTLSKPQIPHNSEQMTEETLYPLCADDKQAFESLKQTFAKKQSSVKEDRHVATFSQEIQSIINFVERRFEGREVRAINAGFMFNGIFICINTRILKNFISRCKSSINSSLQQLGYTSLKTKAKAQECLAASIPCLANDPETARQWTVRFSMNRRCFPFFTSIYSRIPILQPPQQIQKPKPAVQTKPTSFPPRPIIKKTPTPLVVPMVNLPPKNEDISPVTLLEQDVDWGLPVGIGEEDLFSRISEMDWDFAVNSSW